MSFKSENYPANDKRVIFALGHHDQLCCLDGIPNRDKLNILISKSIDGEIIARVVERMGFKTVRGSYNRAGKDKGGKEATFELISRLNNGENIAITVDGASGPLHQVKMGVIKIAKLTGAPIIPVVWYSDSKFLGSLPTWNELKIPLWFLKSKNIYGEPIYVPKTATKKEENEIKKQLKNVLLNLQKNGGFIMDNELKVLKDNVTKINTDIKNEFDKLEHGKIRSISKFDNFKSNNIKFDFQSNEVLFRLKNFEYLDLENSLGKYSTLEVENFTFEKSFITSFSKFKDTMQLKIKTNDFYYKKNKEEKYNIVIWNKPKQLNRIDSFINDNANSMFLCFKLNEINFTVLNFDNEKLFLVSDQTLEKDVFMKYERCIRLALGFIMCDFIGDNVIFVLTDESINNLLSFNIINFSPEENLHFNILIDSLPIVGALYKNKSTQWLTNAQFVALCNLIYENSEIETTLYYISQSASQWIELRLTFLAVALESITKYIISHYDKKGNIVSSSQKTMTKLMNDKEFMSLKNEIKNFLLNNFKFNQTIDDIEKQNIISTLVNKLHNSVSNQDCLSKPFEVFGITLSEDDFNMIKMRNRLLHGTAFDYDHSELSFIEYQKKVYIYYHLLYVLILKLIGFSGVIFNIKNWDKIVLINNKINILNDDIYNKIFIELE